MMKAVFVTFTMLFMMAGCTGSPVKSAKVLPDPKETAKVELTQEQMYEDFGELVDSVKKYFIRIPIVKELFAYDILAQLQILSNRIKDIATKKEFVWLIEQALISLQEQHSTINPWEISFSSQKYLEQEYYKKINQIYRSWIPKYGKLIKLRLPIVYYKGDYIFYRTMTNNQTVINQGSVVKKIEGLPIDDFILKLMSTKHPYWDKFYKKFYNENFYLSEPVYQWKSFTLEFDDHGVIKNGKYSINDQIFQKVTPKQHQPAVMYFPERKTLYIHYSDCFNYQLYEQSIPTYAASDVKKVVIDIRGNGGGMPMMTYHLLGLIIDKPLDYSVSVAINWHSEIKTKLPKVMIDNGKTFFNYFRLDIEVDKKIPFIDYPLDILTESNSIFPQTNSIKYSGKIYLLQDRDIYSAANCLSQMGYISERIVTVGNPAEFFQGSMAGYYVLHVMLPNSKIYFRITDTFDLTGFKGKESLYHDEVEVYIPYSLDDLIDRQTNTIDFYSAEYLLKKDPLMKYVFSLK